MAHYDVSHIDIGRYRELRRLVLEGRAHAVIVVDYIDADAPPVVEQGSLSGSLLDLSSFRASR